MCAIFGFIARDGGRPNLKTLAAIARGNMQRGPHAFGFAWNDAAGRLRMYKQTGRLVDHVGMLSMARDARMLVGHLRWATHGDARNNLNNHPHPADGGWIVHNGIVTNYARLVARRDFSPVTECDSEVLGLLIEDEPGPLLSRVASAVDETTGGLAMLGLWSRPAQLVIARRGNPLHASGTGEGVYLATLPFGLPGRVDRVKDDRVTRMTLRSGRLVNRSIDLRPQRREPARFDVDEPSLYCGG